ncbi:hypothetical protein TRSC58_06733 [Trypanosoma rangeli SC58]|uniref:Uncharacterized protein n=1 Tax=Trypanosoma rangeli SC58 TaxID=429131 RepID=A0A061IUU0_TRYRA|nr:hypothetical protein TRSC58_06733 [Trypanosoma rangeli SC58]
MLSYLMDESAREEGDKFESLLELLSEQLLLRDGDADRLHAAIGALQRLVQYLVVAKPFYNTNGLQTISVNLQSLLCQKPSIGSELSLSVLKLLGTISSIEPYHQQEETRDTKLFIGHPEYSHRLPFLHQIDLETFLLEKEFGGRLGIYFTEQMWPDVILRVLLRTFFEALDGVLTFTSEEIGACLRATVAILREAGTLQSLEHYMLSLLSVLTRLFSRDGVDSPLRVSTMENLAELVQHSGRTIAPMYALLVAFLEQHWVSSWYALPSCCKLLMALCNTVPDLAHEHCERFLSLLLRELMRLVGEMSPASRAADPQQQRGEVATITRVSATRMHTSPSVIREVLKAIHSLLHIADQSATQSACLALAQLLPNPSSTSGPLELTGGCGVQFSTSSSSSTTTGATFFDTEVSHVIAQFLVEFLDDCDVAAKATAVLESVLLQLWHYARTHKAMLQIVAGAQHKEPAQARQHTQRQEQDWHWLRQGSGSRQHALKASVASAMTRMSLEYELRRRRGDQTMWFNCSSLARLLITPKATNKEAAENCSYSFPFRETITSWESPVELELLACMLVVAGRCQLPAVSYELMIGEYLQQRFDTGSPVMKFFHAATAPQYHLSLLPLGAQKPQAAPAPSRAPPPLLPEVRSNKEQERDRRPAPRSPSHGNVGAPIPEATLPRTLLQSGGSSSLQPLKELPPHSTPIPIRTQKPPLKSSRSSSVSSAPVMSSSLATPLMSGVESATHMLLSRKMTPESGRGSGCGVASSVGCGVGGFPYPVSAVVPVVSVIPVAGTGGIHKHWGQQRQLDVFSSGSNGFTSHNMMGTFHAEAGRPPTIEGNEKSNEQGTTMTGDSDSDEDDNDEGNYATEEQRFFMQHENLSSSEWRPWFELFCTMLVESSDHVCVSICSTLVRRHFTIFASDLMPIAFLSHLTKYDERGVLRWMRLICDFVRLHDKLPQNIAAELARLAHHIRLYSPSLFSRSLARTIEQKYITLDLVSVLAERALNSPLLLLCTLQQFYNSFSWEALARLMLALGDVKYDNAPRLFSRNPLVRRAAHQLVQARRQKCRTYISRCGDTPIMENCDFITEALPWETQQGTHSEMNAFSVAATDFSSGTESNAEECMPPAIYLELGWFEVALRQYLRSIWATLRMLPSGGGGAPLTRLPRPKLSLNDVVGAMRCYMRVYDFESIIKLWQRIKYVPFSEEEGWTSTQTAAEQQQQQVLQRILLVTSWAPTAGRPILSYITRYVVSAAQALSRWDLVDEIDYRRFLADARDERDRCSRSYGCPPFYKQAELFRAAALTAAKEYEQAKGILSDLRTALRDSYSVFHTENARLRVELNIMFQQISDLEEGIDAVELKTTLGDATSKVVGPASSMPTHAGTTTPTTTATTANLATATGCVGASAASSAGGDGTANNRREKFSPTAAGNSGGGGCEGVEPQQSRWRGKVAYTEATMRRLKNIAGRPLPAHSTVLQRFELIALRSTLVSPDWQLRNILELSEHIVREGMPKRAVSTLSHFYSLPIDNTSPVEEKNYRDTLLLEKYRIELQHLFRTRDLASLHSEITEELMLMCHGGFMHTPRSMRGLGTGDISVDAFLGLGSVTEKQAELLLLHIECQRKLKTVHHQRQHISLAPSPKLVPRPQIRGVSLGELGMTSRAFLNSASSRDTNLLDGEEDEYNPAYGLLREYRIMEHIIGSSVTLASVWREFGLLLFDVCMAIYAEWDMTREPETLDNFCVQSEKAISAPQKSVQFWSSAIFTSISGIGPFTTASTQRSRHARSALPAVHLLLKALHLALKLEEIGTDGVGMGEKKINVAGALDDESARAASVSAAPERSETWDRGTGIARLDFSPAMFLHWGYVLPILVNAAARHRKLRDAVREMCARSRMMLYQCVFHLASTFEHCHPSLLALEEDAGREGALHYDEAYPCSGLCSLPSVSAAQPTATPATDLTEEVEPDDTMRRTTPCRLGVASAESKLSLRQPRSSETADELPSPVRSPNRRQGERRIRSSSDIQEPQQPQQPPQLPCRHPCDIRPSQSHLQQERQRHQQQQHPHHHHRQQQQWSSAMLLKLAENGPEYKLIISQTLQLCEFVRSGKEKSLALGVCAFPVPTWLLRHHIVEVDGNELESQKGQPSTMRGFPNTTDSYTHAESEFGTRNYDNVNAVTASSGTTIQGGHSKGLPRVLHVRRKICSLSSEHRREEVFLFFLSDGLGIRFHGIEMTEDTAMSAVSCSSVLAECCETHPKRMDTNASVTSTAATASTAMCGGKTSPMELVDHTAFIRPLAAMESAVYCLCGSLPMRYVRTPLVLPVGIQEFITQLPDRVASFSSWQVTLPPSLQYSCNSSMLRQPSSLFHIISEYNARCQEGSSIPSEGRYEHHHQQQSEREHEEKSARKGTHSDDTPTVSVQEDGMRDGVGTGSASRLRRNRRELLTRYERLLELAFDQGRPWPLFSFIRRVLTSKKLSEEEYPRPASQLVTLLEGVREALQQHLREAEETSKGSGKGKRGAFQFFALNAGTDDHHLGDGRGLATVSTRTTGWKTMQTSAAPLTKLRLALLKAEAPWHAQLLSLSFQAMSIDAAQWLDAVHVYTRDLAEWSILQYLFDATHRESTTFFVDLISGHVASLHLGVHALQPLPRSLVSQPPPSVSTGGGGNVIGEEKADVAAPNHSPFPCTDPTIFRLTGCLVASLPLKCPYNTFLSGATQCLYATLRYSRDLAGIVKFGFQDMKCFAWRGALPQQPSPADGSDMNATLLSGSVTMFPEVSSGECVRCMVPVAVLHHADASTGTSIMAASLGGGQSSPPVEEATPMAASNITMIDHTSVVPSPTKTSDTNATLFGGDVVRDAVAKTEPLESHREERKRLPAVTTAASEAFASSTVAKKASTATPSAAKLAQKLSSAMNTTTFCPWGSRMTAPHHLPSPPRLFDAASILVKLMDDRLPMIAEPASMDFADFQLGRSDDLIQLCHGDGSTMESKTLTCGHREHVYATAERGRCGGGGAAPRRGGGDDGRQSTTTHRADHKPRTTVVRDVRTVPRTSVGRSVRSSRRTVVRR